jgi:hypothetical protein
MAKVRCLKCGEELESKSIHDFRMCGCENKTFIDGGSHYTRLGGVDMNLVELVLPSKVDIDENEPWNTLPG